MMDYSSNMIFTAILRDLEAGEEARWTTNVAASIQSLGVNPTEALIAQVETLYAHAVDLHETLIGIGGGRRS